MASSNTPKPHKSPKAKKGEISTTQNKTKEKTRDITKEENQKKKNKKPKLSNGNSKHPHEKGAERSGDDEKANVFPMNRIRTMIKGEDPDMRVSQEAVLAINKAVEKFLEQFTQDAYACCVQDRKKCLGYKHVGLDCMVPSSRVRRPWKNIESCCNVPVSCWLFKALKPQCDRVRQL
ncbi:DNA polymerase epsilon subunit 4 [Vigna unguiculata]|uniref:DNA polymerase epsilon subunit 4 n=1 Tax=Vigna unguiculata TaxID=3917 RepID=A0A4D6LI74_VIGUN|nr:DNA polymerase epsilon subunit 4 [Vigna unguiculata]